MIKSKNYRVHKEELAMKTAIHIQDLHKNYADVRALKGVDFAVREGEIFGALGANGAGKTTMIRILVGATRATQGDVRVMDLHPIKDKRELRRQIGYMPQQPALYEDLSPRQNLRFFAQAHRIGTKLNTQIDKVLEFVDLTERADDPVYGFSGGMKQRVSLACALVHQPKILFLDEPTAGVDPQLREAFWHHFRELANNGTTIVVSTHQMDEAMHCDQLGIMQAGKVLAHDHPKAIMQMGSTRIKIWHGDELIEETVTQYAEQLPMLLETYGLSNISRIEVEEDSLETIVLNLINQNRQEQ